RRRLRRARHRSAGRSSGVRLQLRPLAPRLPGRRLRALPAPVRGPHRPRAHERRVVGPRRRHHRCLRGPHHLRRRAPLLGLPQRRPRRRRLRRDHRGSQRHRLPRAAVGRVGGRAHGPGARCDRVCRVLQAARLRALDDGVRCRLCRRSRLTFGWRLGTRRLRYGMVGGGEGAFIGAVHRHAMALDHRYSLAAGALSSTPERARRSGEALGLPTDRNYPTWEALLEGELARPREERIDLVVIVTPNHVHYPVAKAFAEAGINVVSDKPLVHTSHQAQELVEAVARTGVVFGVTYNYTGYPLVKEARAMIQRGALGALRKVVVGYHQGWLATNLERSGAKQAQWRTDPERSGAAGAIGDIGSHAENLVATVTGLELEAVCADLTTFVPGRRLDDDGNLLLRFKGGAKGVMIASQIEIRS